MKNRGKALKLCAKNARILFASNAPTHTLDAVCAPNNNHFDYGNIKAVARHIMPLVVWWFSMLLGLAWVFIKNWWNGKIFHKTHNRDGAGGKHESESSLLNFPHACSSWSWKFKLMCFWVVSSSFSFVIGEECWCWCMFYGSFERKRKF